MRLMRITKEMPENSGESLKFCDSYIEIAIDQMNSGTSIVLQTVTQIQSKI